MINLIPRLGHPSSGVIELDGIALNDLKLESLRAQLGLVSQDVVLFNDSIRRNVGFGCDEMPGDEQIWAALKNAALDEFVRGLDDGLDHQIGEDGTRLSGGQRQRLAIARALLKDPPILLLDEATSALDSRTERDVQQALEVLMADRTTLVVAHRLSTIERANRIVVMDQGRIVEIGSHAELLAREGAYAGLHRLQSATAA